MSSFSLFFALNLCTLFSESAISKSESLFFESKIRPILIENCYRCHSKEAEKLKGNLLLDSKAGWEAGGENGPVIIPNDPGKSILIKAIEYGNKHLQMPPKEKLPEQAIQAIKQWISMGAPDPRTGDQDYVKNRNRLDILKSQKNYWAYKPLQKSGLPKVKNTSWVKNPIDHFILSKLEKNDIAPNQPTEKIKLIRRLYFDIIGLPPSPESIDSYLKDTSNQATSKLIDELLNNQHYGERWARHWMDVARFAESFGFEQDYNRPFAYFYRDFLIKAFNDDMPYDQFVRWQLAGDEIAPDNPMANMATGFLAAGVFPTQLTEKEFESARYDELDDIVNTTSTAFMGLTLGCARCHSHKYDPIPVGDYYSFAANFATTIRSIDNLKFKKDSPFLKNSEKDYQSSQTKLENYEKKNLAPAFIKWKKKQGKNLSKTKIEEELKKLLNTEFTSLSEPDQTKLLTWFKPKDKTWKKYSEEAKLLKTNFEHDKTRVMVMTEGLKHIPHHADGRGYPHFYENVYHLKRGSPNSKQGIAKPAFLQVLTHESKTSAHWQQSPPSDWRTSYRRKSLAYWMTDTNYGAGHLVARVMVNRLWQHHFGKGIVATPNDFGLQGQKPTHPELLDYLAFKLIENNWSLKSIHRLILNSQSYQMSSAHHNEKSQLDPDNQLLWRRSVKRLEAEAIRDNMLSVSSQLDPTLYGPGLSNPVHQRRSIYFFIKRSQLIPMMRLFDMPSPLSGQGNRQTTTIAPQALMFINNSQIDQLSQKFADRIYNTNHDDKSMIEQGYKIALGRQPTSVELDTTISFLRENENPKQALNDFAKALMSLNEFIYIE